MQQQQQQRLSQQQQPGWPDAGMQQAAEALTAAENRTEVRAADTLAAAAAAPGGAAEVPTLFSSAGVQQIGTSQTLPPTVDLPHVEQQQQHHVSATAATSELPPRHKSHSPLSKPAAAAARVSAVRHTSPVHKPTAGTTNSIPPPPAAAAAAAAAAAPVHKKVKLQVAGSSGRMLWTSDLHAIFLAAVSDLGGAEVATPTEILQLMQVEGITRENVKSHLQKHRQNVREARLMQHMQQLQGTGQHVESSGIALQSQQQQQQQQQQEMLSNAKPPLQITAAMVQHPAAGSNVSYGRRQRGRKQQQQVLQLNPAAEQPLLPPLLAAAAAAATSSATSTAEAAAPPAAAVVVKPEPGVKHRSIAQHLRAQATAGVLTPKSEGLQHCSGAGSSPGPPPDYHTTAVDAAEVDHDQVDHSRHRHHDLDEICHEGDPDPAALWQQQVLAPQRSGSNPQDHQRTHSWTQQQGQQQLQHGQDSKGPWLLQHQQRGHLMSALEQVKRSPQPYISRPQHQTAAAAAATSHAAADSSLPIDPSGLELLSTVAADEAGWESDLVGDAVQAVHGRPAAAAAAAAAADRQLVAGTSPSGGFTAAAADMIHSPAAVAVDGVTKTKPQSSRETAQHNTVGSAIPAAGLAAATTAAPPLTDVALHHPLSTSLLELQPSQSVAAARPRGFSIDGRVAAATTTDGPTAEAAAAAADVAGSDRALLSLSAAGVLSAALSTLDAATRARLAAVLQLLSLQGVISWHQPPQQQQCVIPAELNAVLQTAIALYHQQQQQQHTGSQQ